MSVISTLHQLSHSGARPFKVMIELSARCPLHCVHCYVTQSKEQRLNLAVLEPLLDELASLGVLFLSLTGGEVALHPELFEIVAAARQRTFAVTLLSSGTLWRDAEWDRLASLGVGTVRMSLYGASAAVHDAVTRVPGAHGRTLASARGLLNRGVGVDLNCPVMASNAHEVPQMVELALSLGARASIDTNLNWTDRGSDAPVRYAASSEQLVAVLSNPALAEHVPKPKVRAGRDADGPACLVGRSSAFIDASGQVFPCVRWPRAAGSLFDRPFTTIWRESVELLASRAITNSELSQCLDCENRPYCSPCPAMNLQERGSLRLPSLTLCRTAAARAAALAGAQPACE